MTLLGFIALYLIASIGIGVYAATRVRNTADYALAGRSLPLFVIVATTFATWFGSETVLGIPSKFVEGGFRNTVEDPFGAGLCLVLVGMFFARKLYNMDLLTIGDFYRRRYGRGVEIFSSIVILISYLGWVAAQITALGLVFNLLSAGGISVAWGMVLGTVIVLVYTLFGGMWSVALTDTFQMVIIIVGLSLIAIFAADQAGGAGKVIEYAQSREMFRFFPDGGAREWLFWTGAAITIMIGSIPQQDVFQRVMSAKDADTSVKGPIIGGISYMVFALVPIFIGLSAFLVMPEAANALLKEDSQKILPTLGDGAHARVAAGRVLRRAAGGDHVNRIGHVACTFDDVRRKRAEELRQDDRQAGTAVHAIDGGRIHRMRADLFDHHDRHADLRAGFEGVSVSGRRRVLAAGVRALLAALDDAGCDLVDHPRHGHVGTTGIHAARATVPARARRIFDGGSWNVRRFAAISASAACSGCRVGALANRLAPRAP